MPMNSFKAVAVALLEMDDTGRSPLIILHNEVRPKSLAWPRYEDVASCYWYSYQKGQQKAFILLPDSAHLPTKKIKDPKTLKNMLKGDNWCYADREPGELDLKKLKLINKLGDDFNSYMNEVDYTPR